MPERVDVPDPRSPVYRSGTCWDVFNGDADGLCALQQLRLAESVESVLVTGTKRDSALLDRVPAASGDCVTVLDISMARNAEALERLLAAGVTVWYCDHHFPGEIPSHPCLTALIDTSPDTCTSILVDRCLNGRFRAWAAVGAFGDNLEEQGRLIARGLGCGGQETALLRELGIYLNYNAYGATVEDLHVSPNDLFRRLQRYKDPLQFVAAGDTFELLRRGYIDDMARTEGVRPVRETATGAAYILPAERWARRVAGTFANRLARAEPHRAHALAVTLRGGGGYMVSVRAPLLAGAGADELCRRFPTGGGRKAAAGINRLPPDRMEEFVADFLEFYR